TVVSGLAAGIDTEAHIGCLEAGGRTFAVVGTGVDIVYPKQNERLCDRILQQGLVISEYPAGTQPNRTNFPRRNRIIAGLSRATIVIEAPHKSGALITAYQANDFCRDVYVLTARLDDERSFGCLELLSK
ncbi:DNA-protecting protein DprA, partial [Microcoleus sp. HI-ES]|nr:DNA-protecting protein DprA [Microcoleus sp. HI-ES]